MSSSGFSSSGTRQVSTGRDCEYGNILVNFDYYKHVFTSVKGIIRHEVDLHYTRGMGRPSQQNNPRTMCRAGECKGKIAF